MGVPFFYTGMQTLIVGCFCLIAWKSGWTKAPTNVNIFDMLVKNYQEEGESETTEEEDEEKDEKDEEKAAHSPAVVY